MRAAVCMKVLMIVLQICILYIFSFIGITIQQYFSLTIPGNIIGMLLLFICLCFNIVPVKMIESGAQFLLSILMLFFIPATVGVMDYPQLLSVHGLLLIMAILISTMITLAVSGKTTQYFAKKTQKREADQVCKSSSSRSL